MNILDQGENPPRMVCRRSSPSSTERARPGGAWRSLAEPGGAWRSLGCLAQFRAHSDLTPFRASGVASSLCNSYTTLAWESVRDGARDAASACRMRAGRRDTRGQGAEGAAAGSNRRGPAEFRGAFIAHLSTAASAMVARTNRGSLSASDCRHRLSCFEPLSGP